jgi:hypothetical protein
MNENKNSNLLKELTALKQKKALLLERKQKYVQQHQLEFFKPQEQQKPVYEALLDPKVTQICVLGGNRSGKSELLVTAVCAFAEHRFPWVPLPQPLPKPVSITQTSEALKVRFTELPDGIQLIPGVTVHQTTYTPEVGFYETPKRRRTGKHPKPCVEVVAPDKKAYNEWVEANKQDSVATRFKGPLKIRVLGEDYEKAIGQTLLPKFFRFLRPELIASKRKNQSGVVNQIILMDGTVIDFLTYQQASDTMEGWDGHIAAYDEPPPRDMYIANARGLIDHNGISLFAMTPLKEPWIADEIANSPSGDTKTFVLNTYDNPYLDAKTIKAFEDKLNDDEKQTRIHGKFLHLQGLVFKEFNMLEHVIEPFTMPRSWTTYVAIDTHPRTEQALLFVVVDNRGQVYSVHEIFEHGTPEDVAEWIIEYHANQRKIHMAVIEPGSQGDSQRGDTTFRIIEKALAAHHIPLELGSKDLAGGILQVRQMLKTPNKRPALFVFNHLARLVFEFTHYIWDDWKARSSSKTEKQRPRDKDDHMIENLRRLIQHPVTYVDPGHVSSLLQEANSGYVPLDSLSGY